MPNQQLDIESITNAVINEKAILTSEQKAGIVEHTNWCAEGEYQISELEAMSDVELCKACESAMWDWVRCNT